MNTASSILRRLAWPVLAILALGVAGRYLPLGQWMEQAQTAIWGMGGWAYVIYPLLFALCNLLLLPGTVLALGSGFFFGIALGTGLTLLGNMIGAAVAFFISHRLARRWLEARLHGNERWQRLNDAVGKEGWKIIFLTQALPLFPSSLLNYLYPLTSIPFRSCMIWTAVAQVPQLFLYHYLGSMARLGLDASSRGPWEIRLQIAGLVLSILGFLLLIRITLRLMLRIKARDSFDTPAFSGSVKEQSNA